MNTKHSADASAGKPCLFDDFSPPTLDEWRSEIERLLRGAPFDRKMFTQTYEGITLRPMYTAADMKDLKHLESLPGQAPFVRGTKPLGYRQQPWLVAQEIACPQPAGFNTALLHDLARGQTAVNLVIGPGGTTIDTLADMEAALSGVDLATTPVLLRAGNRALPIVMLLAEVAAKHGVDLAELHGTIFFDPLHDVAATDAAPLDDLYDDLATLSTWTAANAPDLRCIGVCAELWHNAGGSVVHQLAFALAAALEHLRQLEKRGLSPAALASQVQFSFAVGTNFFMEIAGLRAARLLWSRTAAACGADEEAARLHVHCQTSHRTISCLDPHTNLLRSTTEALAAVLGGCDSLHVAPYDEAFRADGASGRTARRCARNIQIILQHESHLDRVIDPAGGCWYVESLTDELAKKAWALFQEIEGAGGMAAALADGLPQRLAAGTADERAHNLATRRDVVVGANMYATAEEAPTATDKSGDHGMPRLRDAEVFEQMRAGISARRAEESSGHDQAQVFVAALGPVAEYMPRLDFTRSFFAVGGLAVAESGHFDTPAAAADAASGSGCPVVVIVSTDKNYQVNAAATARALKAIDPPPIVVLAGHPGDNRKTWTEAGVDHFIQLHSNLPKVLHELAAAIWPTTGGLS